MLDESRVWENMVATSLLKILLRSECCYTLQDLCDFTLEHDFAEHVNDGMPRRCLQEL